MAHTLSPEMRRCIDECPSCHDVCAECVPHCLELGGPHAAPEHIRMLLDCAEICATSANFMLRNSDMHGDVCEVCADACDACAASCESLSDDAMMSRCAEECRRCAKSCREMAGVEAA